MPLLFLNEKSCGTDCDPLQAEKAMGELARTVISLVRADQARRTSLVSIVPLNTIELAAGYPIGKWIGKPKNRDLWQRLRRAQSKAPYPAVLPGGEEALDVEYRHEGVTVRALGAAHLMDGLGVSLPVHACWDASVLVLERERLVELPDGETDCQVSQVEVRHASAERHIDAHRQWLKTSHTVTAKTGAELWEKRAELYPHLQFLPRVEDDLRALDPFSVAVVQRRLTELEEAVAEWDPEGGGRPRWRGYVRGEFETRKQQCAFTDLDGEERLFYLHTDFPPKPGRLHFRLVPEEKAVRVAYIGRKLGV